MNIKEILPYYIGQKIRFRYYGSIDYADFEVLTPDVLVYALVDHGGIFIDCQLALRPLSDITEEEMKECGNLLYDFSSDPELNNWSPTDFDGPICAEQFHWLIKNGFDVFSGISKGWAVDKTTLNQ